MKSSYPWRRWLARLLGVGVSQHSQHQIEQRYRPRVEPLEDRLAPASFNLANGDVPGLVTAITTSNGNAQPDTINLAPGGTYTLSVVDNGTDGNTGLPAILADGGNALTIN